MDILRQGQGAMPFLQESAAPVQKPHLRCPLLKSPTTNRPAESRAAAKPYRPQSIHILPASSARSDGGHRSVASCFSVTSRFDRCLSEHFPHNESHFALDSG